jgi:hypothetical protein
MRRYLGWLKLPVTCPPNFIPVLFQFKGIWFQVSGVRIQLLGAYVLTPDTRNLSEFRIKMGSKFKFI